MQFCNCITLLYKEMKKKSLSILLIVFLLFTLLPFNVFAEDQALTLFLYKNESEFISGNSETNIQKIEEASLKLGNGAGGHSGALVRNIYLVQIEGGQDLFLESQNATLGAPYNSALSGSGKAYGKDTKKNFNDVKETYSVSKAELIDAGMQEEYLNAFGGQLYFICVSDTSKTQIANGNASLEDAAFYGILIHVKPADNVDKTALNDAIAKVTGDNAKNWYQTDDRYNGNPDDVSSNGFWNDMLPVLSEAQTISEGNIYSQEEVGQATANLNTAISRLIPTTQANTTALYEALELVKDVPETNAQYTETSWKNFDDARAVAQEQMEQLFDNGVASGTYNIPESQDAIDNAATVLTAAYRDLIGEGNLEENISLWKKAATWLLAQNQQVENGEYTSESATAWENAYTALQEACLLYTSPSPRD